MVPFIRKAAGQIMAMPKPDNLYHTFGIIFLLLASIGVISFTSKFIFGFGMIKSISALDRIYDPDHGRNLTRLCPYSTDAYRIQFNQTVCFNKTMHYRYIPWLYLDVWKMFSKMNEEKRMKRLKDFKMMKEIESDENNETKSENAATETIMTTETPANRKMKDEPSKIVCMILAALLVISSTVAFCEVFRDKFMNKAKTSPRKSKQSFSFADSSSNEHNPIAQRQEPFQSTAKVTQSLVHQTSLDRAFSRLSSEAMKPLFRRSSVPAQLVSSATNEVIPSTRGYSPGYGHQTTSTSSDSPEMQRRSRHFIRRH